MRTIVKKAGSVMQKMTAQIVLLVLLVYFGARCGGAFFSVNNLISIVRQVTTMGIAAQWRSGC